MSNSSICVQLGDAKPSADTNGAKVLTAATVDELVAARQSISPSSVKSLQFIVPSTELGKLYGPMELANWSSCLKKDATVTIVVQTSSDDDASSTDVSSVSTSFVLAGLALSSERREADGSRVLVATKKVQDMTAAPLKSTVNNNNNRVTVSLGDDDDDDNMIDEDGLLEDTDGLLGAPPAMSEAAKSGDDCGGRKACDDCTCGRAEKEAADAKAAAAPVKTSSCGKCGMGDAFRCASCPYLGKPAFKPGEEHLVLQLNDDL